MRQLVLAICVAAAFAGSLWASGEPAPQVIPRPSPDGMVYLTQWGKRYHKATCGHIKSSSARMKLEEAKKRFTPCPLCKPPT